MWEASPIQKGDHLGIRGSVSVQGIFLGYFQSLPLWVRQPILIVSPL